MATFPFFGSSQGAGKQPQFLSDMAAAEQEVEAYFARLASQPKVEPEAAAAFELNDQQAIEAYNKWLNSLSMAPGDITKRSDLGSMKATFIPFWVVSSMTYTTYKGERGLNHEQQEIYTDAEGNLQTRGVTQTRWSPALGEITHYFENRLICGKGEMPPEHVTLLTPKDLSKQQQYVASEHKAAVEPYSVDPKAAFNKARVLMDAKIKKLCIANIGGDQQRVASTQTRFVGVSVHHVLLPCYQGSYKYRDKTYDILINGVTGKIVGDRPYSGGKIAVLVLVILLVIAAIGAAVYFFVIAPNMKKAESPERDGPAAGYVASVEDVHHVGQGFHADPDLALGWKRYTTSGQV